MGTRELSGVVSSVTGGEADRRRSHRRRSENKRTGREAGRGRTYWTRRA